MPHAGMANELRDGFSDANPDEIHGDCRQKQHDQFAQRRHRIDARQSRQQACERRMPRSSRKFTAIALVTAP